MVHARVLDVVCRPAEMNVVQESSEQRTLARESKRTYAIVLEVHLLAACPPRPQTAFAGASYCRLRTLLLFARSPFLIRPAHAPVIGLHPLLKQRLWITESSCRLPVQQATTVAFNSSGHLDRYDTLPTHSIFRKTVLFLMICITFGGIGRRPQCIQPMSECSEPVSYAIQSLPVPVPGCS